MPAATLGPELAGLLQVVIALALVSALAFGVLRALARRGIGKLGPGTVQVEQRVFLDAQSGLLVVQVEGRRLLLATHRNAPARLLTELAAASAGSPAVAPPTSGVRPEA